MSSTPLVPSFRLPSKIPDGVVHPTVKKAIENNVNGLVDVNQAISSLKAQVDAVKATASAATTTTAATVTPVVSTSFPGLGTVNNQEGNTSYTTASSDNGALILLSNASPIAVTLNSVTQVPFLLFITNLGSGTATLTPSSGLVNGAASFALLQNYTAICVLQNNTPGAWWATALPIVPVTFNAVAHEFLISYNATLGTFSAAQPAFTDISGIATITQIGTGTPAAGKYVDGAAGAWTALPTPPTVPSTIAPVAGEYFTGYNAGTGLFSQSTPAGISAVITTAALTVGGTQGSMVFTNGILTSQVQAT